MTQTGCTSNMRAIRSIMTFCRRMHRKHTFMIRKIISTVEKPVPDGCLMWKDDLRKGIIDYKVAEKAADTLAAVHNHCAGNEEIARLFENKDVFYALRISPYINFTVTKHPEIAEFAQKGF